MSEFVKFIISVGNEQLEKFIAKIASDSTQEEVLENILQAAGLSSASVDVIPIHIANSELIRTMPAHTCIDQPSLACPACVAAHLRKEEVDETQG